MPGPATYPVLSGGEWTRGPNLVDDAGRFQPRQEHAAVELNGFVYLIGGFVPRPVTPTEDEPEPFPFVGTGDVAAYTPRGHASAPSSQEGRWRILPAGSAFPFAAMHHIIAVTHRGRIWTFGGHAGPFSPTTRVQQFTPASRGSAEGTWSRVRVRDGRPCEAGARDCLELPRARAAGAAVSVGRRIYLLGGVVHARRSADPVNESIRTTDSVLYLDTGRFPLRWRRAPSLREPREHFNAVTLRDRVWVFHGRNERSTHLRGVESWGTRDARWRAEQNAPVGTSANILGAVGSCVYSFGGEFIASNISGTTNASQVFDARGRRWRRLRATVRTEPLDASGATSKHGAEDVPFAVELRRRPPE